MHERIERENWKFFSASRPSCQLKIFFIVPRVLCVYCDSIDQWKLMRITLNQNSIMFYYVTFMSNVYWCCRFFYSQHHTDCHTLILWTYFNNNYFKRWLVVTCWWVYDILFILLIIIIILNLCHTFFSMLMLVVGCWKMKVRKFYVWKNLMMLYKLKTPLSKLILPRATVYTHMCWMIKSLILLKNVKSSHITHDMRNFNKCFFICHANINHQSSVATKNSIQRGFPLSLHHTFIYFC